ncbi:MAG: hypothetical protein I8H71_01460 [Xanthomonadaceae bacterium]|nr:hypothetical protein [Xanthomonadaceae bacterium]
MATDLPRLLMDAARRDALTDEDRHNIGRAIVVIQQAAALASAPAAVSAPLAGASSVRFEIWARDNISQPRFSGRHVREGAWAYDHHIVDLAWRCWQQSAAQPATQAGAAIVWPTMPPGLKQSAVLFEDGYAEGWAKCLTECKKAVLKGAAEPDMRAGDPRNPIRHPRIHDGYVAGWNARGPQPSQDAEVWDRPGPQLATKEHGCEPSIREVLAGYYRYEGFESRDADKLASGYIDAALAAQAQGESTGGTPHG